MGNDPSRPDDVIALAEERLTLGRREVESDRVRVRTVVEERPETIAATLQRRLVEVERVPVFREVLAPPPPREDGDTLVFSVVEERLVKRSFVVEEVRIRTRTVEEQAEFSAPVRTTRAEVERADIHPERNENG